MSVFLTQQGVESDFASQGPDLEYYAISQIAQTIRRPCPGYEKIQDCKFELGGTLADTYWPLDGTRPLEELARWDFGKQSGYGLQRYRTERSVSPPKNAGFMSAASIPATTLARLPTLAMDAKPVFVSAAARLQDLEQAQEEGVLKKLDKRAQDAMQGKTKKAQRVATGPSSITSYFCNPHATKPQPVVSSGTKSGPKDRTEMLR